MLPEARPDCALAPACGRTGLGSSADKVAFPGKRRNGAKIGETA
jgi:hypothetical protein